MPVTRETRVPALPGFEWRAPLEPWRWLLLGALGLSACLDDSSPEGAAARTTPSACEAGSSLAGGWEQCQNGMLHRPVAGVCPSLLPRPSRFASEPVFAPTVDAGSDEGRAPFTPSATVQCLQDSDCTAAPHGYCEADVAIYCRYGCVSDSDCGAGEVCSCGDVIGQCSPASCRTDADCGAGSLCGSYSLCPGSYGFSCQTPEDECAVDADCSSYFSSCGRRVLSPSGGQSIVREEQRTCLALECPVPGRPFLIEGVAQRAQPSVRRDWYPAEGKSALVDDGIGDATLRSAVVHGWTEQALMEHASAAAFARFTLQLLQLGAPAALVSASSQAVTDEIRHARACFELARRHGGADVGPGPLDVTGALACSDLEAVVLDTVREGCIGETVAALESAEALQHCEDPATRPVLAAIAAEELQHAELAWRFVAWALERAPASLHAEVRRAFAAASASSDRGAEPMSSLDHALARHGLLAGPVRRALQRRVLAGVVAPCAQALLAGPCVGTQDGATSRGHDRWGGAGGHEPLDASRQNEAAPPPLA